MPFPEPLINASSRHGKTLSPELTPEMVQEAVARLRQYPKAKSVTFWHRLGKTEVPTQELLERAAKSGIVASLETLRDLVDLPPPASKPMPAGNRKQRRAAAKKG